MSLFSDMPVVVKGGGDLGTGVAWRLHKCGFVVIVTELAQPLVVRRTVAFASAVYDGDVVVEGVAARMVRGADEARLALRGDFVPVLVDPDGAFKREIAPRVLVDAILAKRNTGTQLDDAPLVIALGPGFTPTVDCHCVVETMRGHDLGRVLWNRPAASNTGVPGEIGGKGAERVLRSPVDGVLTGASHIGDLLGEGDVVARVGDRPILAPFAGILRGLVHDGLAVRAGMKVGDVDPRAQRDHCFTLSDKALAIGGGVLQGVLEWLSTVP